MPVRGLVPLFVLALVTAAGCQSASTHRTSVRDDEGDRVSVGTVQKEIRVGMSGAEVIDVLGSPNIVTTDEQRREVWVYDKISTERAYSTSSGGVYALILWGWREAGAASTSQRTLTVIVKFDEEKRVRDFAYHSTSF